MEKSILSCEELHSFLRSGDYECLTAYEKDIDPIHYFVFVRNVREKSRIEKFICGRRLEGLFPFGRVIMVIPLCEMISHKWLDDVFSRSVNGVMLREDLAIIGLVYNMARCRRNSFIRMNMAAIFGISCSDEAIYSFLFGYMQKYGYSVKLSFLDVERKKFTALGKKYDLLSFGDVLQIPWLYVKSKCCSFAQKHKALDKGINEHYKNVQEYIDFVVRELNISDSYEILNPGGNYYGCCFIRAGDILIKGNEYTQRTNSFRIELNAQKKLAGLSDKDKELFICMNSYYDGEKKYIVYPFVEGVPLGVNGFFVTMNVGLSRKKLDNLAEFMLKALDVLYEAGIVHRDFTPWNIMCEGERFRLFDFGCAYSGEPDIICNDKVLDTILKGKLSRDCRYSPKIYDDAASAYITYLYCGGSPDDEYAVKLKSRIGRFYCA